MGAGPLQRCMLALKRPTPVLRRLSGNQFLRERSAPGGRLEFAPCDVELQFGSTRRPIVIELDVVLLVSRDAALV